MPPSPPWPPPSAKANIMMLSKRSASLVFLIAGLVVGYHFGFYHLSCIDSGESKSKAVSTDQPAVIGGGDCEKLGLPQPMDAIPLSPSAYEFDHSGTTANFFVATADRDVEPPVILAMPNEARLAARINRNTGRMEVRNNGNIWNRITESSPDDGIFIDVGGWVGDTSIPSAAVGIDTYVFEPVRNNTNMIHFATMANGCHVSKHLTIINALVGDRDSASESVYVTAKRADNAAATRAQATANIVDSADNYNQPVQMVKLDSFFPPGTKVQNLKIDVQGYELHVLRGAERMLRENKDGLHLRFEHSENLLKAAGTDPSDVLAYMAGLGYAVVRREDDDLDWRGTAETGEAERRNA